MKKRYIIALLALVLLLAGCTSTGWVTEDGNTHYYSGEGEKLTGWQTIDGKLFYFDSTGSMQTGWLELEEGIFCLDPQGNPLSGWQTLEGKTYYFQDKGRMTTGWQDTDRGRCFFLDDGTVATGWQDTDRGRRYFLENGAMATGRQELPDGVYYLDAEGAALTGWQTIDGQKRYLDGEGKPFLGLAELEDGLYYFGEEGSPTTGWVEEDGKTYFFDEDGIAITGWQEYGQYRRYFDIDGVMAVGPKVIDEQKYFFTPKGYEVLLTNRYNPLPEDYPMEIVRVGPGCDMDIRVAEDFKRMWEDVHAAGHAIGVRSSFRTFIDQRGAYNRKVMALMDIGYSYEIAQEKAQTHVSKPGCSEHQTGLAVDIEGWDGLMWLEEHCWEYGFILRFPEDKAHITGVMYEPWHFRYVGVEIAMDMKDTGLCLEEYLQAVETELPAE